MPIAPDNVARRRGNRVKRREFLGVIDGVAAWPPRRRRDPRCRCSAAPPSNKQSRPRLCSELGRVEPIAASAEKGLACRDWRLGIPGERRTDGVGWTFLTRDAVPPFGRQDSQRPEPRRRRDRTDHEIQTDHRTVMQCTVPYGGIKSRPFWSETDLNNRSDRLGNGRIQPAVPQKP